MQDYAGYYVIKDRIIESPGQRIGQVNHFKPRSKDRVTNHYMHTNQPRSKDRAYDLENQSHKTGN